ncbi:MAG: phage holin family protein [Defluviitaleaceae bacterium]|nr:phage holin family protein [Defluviitaleaceae bacterium]
MKTEFLTGIGVIGGLIISALGGWDAGLHALFSLMAIDYISAWIVASIFKKCKKTDNGLLNSNIGFKGLLRKGMQLLIVIIGYELDLVVGTNFIRNGIIIAFISNELISIMENAGLMGIPLPPVINKALDILNKNS